MNSAGIKNFYNYVLFFEIKGFDLLKEKKIKYFCKYITLNIDILYIHILCTFQEKILKFVLKKEKEMIAKVKNILNEKVQSNLDKKTKKFLSENLKKIAFLKAGEKKYSNFWGNPNSWNLFSSNSIEKNQKISYGNFLDNKSESEPFLSKRLEKKVLQKILKKKEKINERNNYLKKISNKKKIGLKKRILYPYFNLCLNRITGVLRKGDFFFPKKSRKKNSDPLIHEQFFSSRGDITDESLLFKKNSINLKSFFTEEGNLPLQKQNLRICSYNLVNFLEDKRKNYPFCFFNIFSIIRGGVRKKEVLLSKILEFLEEISYNFLSVNQTNPYGDIYCFFFLKV